MGNKGDSPDLEIARIAARQYGVVTHRQLLAAGLGRSAISKRAGRGRLHRLHRGVYAVGHVAFDIERHWMAAVLACGDGAVLSHGSAAAHWGLLRPFDGPVEVSVPSNDGYRQRPGIRLHRCASLRDGGAARP
jgi:predicted transcriptional regulator of viral defense system